MKQLIDFFEKLEIDSVLDVGTGTGGFLEILISAFPNAKITGVDPNIDSLEKAKDKYPDFVFSEMGAEKLAFPDDTFDVVSISMAMHHLPNVSASFKEMKRVLKPGAWIIVSELFSDNLNAAQEVHKMFHHFRSTCDRILGINHNETFKKEEIIQLVKESGISLQFHFEWLSENNLITAEEEIERRVEQMKTMLESVKDFPEYKKLKPQIEEFRERAKKYGFQPATRVVVVGKVK